MSKFCSRTLIDSRNNTADKLCNSRPIINNPTIYFGLCKCTFSGVVNSSSLTLSYKKIVSI